VDDLTFLEELRTYIERCELERDQEWGTGKSLEQLIYEGDMPPLYHEVLRRQRELNRPI